MSGLPSLPEIAGAVLTEQRNAALDQLVQATARGRFLDDQVAALARQVSDLLQAKPAALSPAQQAALDAMADVVQLVQLNLGTEDSRGCRCIGCQLKRILVKHQLTGVGP